MAVSTRRPACRPVEARREELAAPRAVALLALLLLLPLQASALTLPGMDEEQVRQLSNGQTLYKLPRSLGRHLHLASTRVLWPPAVSCQSPALQPPTSCGSTVPPCPPTPSNCPFWCCTIQTVTQDDPAVAKLKGMLGELREKVGRHCSMRSSRSAVLAPAWGGAAVHAVKDKGITFWP